MALNEVDTINGNYPVLVACLQNNTDMAQNLMAYGLENGLKLKINKSNRNGMIPIKYARKNKNNILMNSLRSYAEVANIPLEIEEDLNEKDSQGRTALLRVFEDNNMEKSLGNIFICQRY